MADAGGVDPAARRANLVAPMLLAAAVLLALAAALYGPALLSALLGEAAVARARPHALAAVRRAYLVGAVGLALAGLAAARVRPLDRRLRRPAVATGALALLGLALPLAVLELGLAPVSHYHPTTGLFLRDDELGWRMRPDAVEVWGDQLVETNSLGLRGPELAARKPAGVKRVLFLGDSVTFGYRVAQQSAFPSICESLWREAGHPVEAINAGVGGYSPWQYDRYLRRAGLALDPDVIVVGFVLNDVTEKFQLVRFGGSQQGVQLAQSLASFQDHLARHSNVFYQLRRVLRRWRFGADPGALQELDVRALVARPDDPAIATAWRITLENLDRVFDASAGRGVPALLLVLPEAFQLADPPARRVPQRLLREHARARELPFLDAIAPIEAAMAQQRLPAGAFFLDADHLSGRGHRVVAAAVAEAIEARGWLDAPAAPE